jgi:hypothetical protein
VIAIRYSVLVGAYLDSILNALFEITLKQQKRDIYYNSC